MKIYSGEKKQFCKNILNIYAYLTYSRETSNHDVIERLQGS
jgi:hypothetical protein